MKWPLRNCGTACLRDVTDTVQTVQYSDSTLHVYGVRPPRKLLDLFLLLRRPSRSLSTLVLLQFRNDQIVLSESYGTFFFLGGSPF